MKWFSLSLLASVLISSGCCADTGQLLCDMADLSGWKGLTADPAVTYKGLPAPKWDHAKDSVALTSSIPHDWTAHNCLSFALHSGKATGASFMLILASENPDVEGMDYYSQKITLDWTGWKEFTIPFADMDAARSPLGWDKIASVSFTAEGWGNQPNPESVVHIANLRLGTIASPGISDEELFEMLDPAYPGLEKTAAAVKSGDMAEAKHEFAEYLRNRTKPVWNFDWRARPKHGTRPEGVDTKDADRILQRDLPSVGVYHKFEGRIDWTLDPIDYKEWPFQLNRHQFWVTLGRAYWATGEEKYAREFVFQMMDWVKQCPVPRSVSGNASNNWRTIEAGIRMGHNWPEAYHLFLASPSFTDDAIVTMVKSCAEHARHLMRWPTTGNWLTMEADGLMHVGVLFPEFKEAADWRKTATDRLYAELDKQVYPDGAQIELSTGYHQVSLTNFVKAWEIAHLNGVAMPADYIAKIQRMYDYNLLASMPNGYLPGLNDAGATGIRRWLEQGFKLFPDRKDYQWVATGGKSGEEPKVGSIALPFSGHLVMRSGWKPESLYMLFDAGPFGYGHQHEDSLNIVLYAYGKYLLVDPGNYPYDSSQWRKYVLSTRAHNTIRVDGEDQHSRGKSREKYVVSQPLPNRWASCPEFDYASSTYTEGYGDTNQIKVTHNRRVFFVKPEYWIVVDTLTPSDDQQHSYESMFHLDAERAEVDEQSKSVRTVNADAANLAIIPMADSGLSVRIVSGQEKPIVQGWMPSGGYDVRPIPTPIFGKSGSGPVTLAYALYPTPKGGKCPVTGVEPVKVEGGTGIAVHFAGDRVDYYVQSSKPGSIVKFLDFETNAEAAYVRTEGGNTTQALMADGNSLKQKAWAIDVHAEEVRDLSETKVRHRF